MADEDIAFTAVTHDGDFEVRDYPAFIVAEVNVTGSRDEASTEGFKLLADYIFGGNTRRQSIAMTAPVAQSGGDGAWTVRFTMPSAYTLATLPRPNDPRVQLVPVPSQRYAVVRFSGLAKVTEVERRTDALKGFMQRQKLTGGGDASLARYDPPWTLWFMRRNEVWIAVVPAG